MTVALFKLFEQLPPSERSPLPPSTLTTQSVDATPVRTPSGLLPDLSMANHFAYGAACGLIYAALPDALKRKPALSGLAFGLAVWSGSYFGWTPLLGYRANGYRMPLNRNLMMLAAHVVWGASLGITEDTLRRNGDAMLKGRRKAPSAE